MISNAATVVITTILAIIFVSFLLSFPLMLLWNGCLVPAIQVLNQVSWLQMWGISILIGCLFKTTVSTK
jgi:hypothetical protein